MDKKEQTRTPRLTLRKGERLHHRTLVNNVYDKGEALYCYPLRLQWRACDADELRASFRAEIPAHIDPLQMMVTIPKRKQRHAVDRVLLRRRVREAYRLNRLELKEIAKSSGYATISLSFIYISPEKCTYGKIERAMKTLLVKIAEKLG